jgi:preprotein translocase subunit SecE
METILIVIVALIFAGAALLAVDGAIQWIRRLIP